MQDFRTVTICSVILSVLAGAALAQQAAGPQRTPMILTSTSFVDGGILADKNTAASAKPVSPDLSWSDPPGGTVSFALIVHDIDADPFPTIGHLHWAIFNIPANVRSLAEGQPNVPQLPDGSIQIAAPTVVGYRGPAFAGSTYHHYSFELYALDSKLPLGPDATGDDIFNAMKGHIIGKAVDVERFHRS